jgi:hypothetical protein
MTLDIAVVGVFAFVCICFLVLAIELWKTGDW